MPQAHFETEVAALTPGESRHLTMLEKRIERGLGTFREVGEALLEIRDKRLFRVTHPSFEGYCRDKWQLDRGRAYQLMSAAEVGREVPVANEAQARELAPIFHSDPNLAKQVWAEAAKSDEPVTAPRLREAIRTVTGTVIDPKPVQTSTTALVALLNRTAAEYEKWKASKPGIAERTAVKQALNRLTGVAGR